MGCGEFLRSSARALRPCAVLAAVVLILSSAAATPGYAGFGTDLAGNLETCLAAQVPSSVDAVAAGTTLAGNRCWAFALENSSSGSVTNPTVTVNTGFAPSTLRTFDEGSFSIGPALTSLPFVISQPTLAPGAKFCCSGLISTLPLNQDPGFDISRTVSPLIIQTGGSVQTVTVTVRQTRNNPHFKLRIESFVPGVSVVSAAGPSNLTQGESVGVFQKPNGVAFVMNGGIAGVSYSFAVALNVPNPLGSPFESKPLVGIIMFGLPEPPVFGTGSAVKIPEATLDGGVPGSGLVVYSASGSFTWGIELNHTFVNLILDPTPPCSQNSQGNQNQTQNSQGCANP